MERFRIWRGRSAALALAPVAVATTIGALSAIGPASAAETGGTALEASQSRVGPNARVTLEGRFRTPRTAAAPANGTKPGSGSDSQQIRIQFRALGAKSWSDAKQAKTGRSGRFSERVEVDRSGRFRAVSSDGRTTPADLVTVKSKTRARVTDDTAKIGQNVKIKGNVAPAGTRRKVAVRVGGETLSTYTSKNGGFAVRWKANELGTSTVRVRAEGNKIAAGSGDKAGKVAVLRPAVASYYGPGLYGNPLGCGGTLQPDTVGVAHKSLPCGTKLTVAYGSRSVETKVIDRGPYVGGREFDLTEALKNKLGFGSTGTVYVSK